MRRRILTLLASVALLVACATSAAAQAVVVEYYHLDALGSVRVVTDQAGQVIARHDFLPFGEEWNPSPTAHEKKLFTGHERDAETALDYFGARYYRPQIGRFTTVDPAQNVKESLVVPQKWNRYAYVRNNPLKFLDPDGREDEAAWSYFVMREQVRQIGGDRAVAQMDKRNALVAGTVVGGLAGVAVATEVSPAILAFGQHVLSWVGDKIGPSATEAGKVALKFDPGTILNDANKASHMFQPGHQLQLLGGNAEALNQIADAARSAYNAGALSLDKAGVFQQYMSIAGQKVLVQGRIIGDVLRIGDAWIPKI